jgi:hypothetical protein
MTKQPSDDLTPAELDAVLKSAKATAEYARRKFRSDTSEMLTPSEMDALRRSGKEMTASLQKALAERKAKKP